MAESARELLQRLLARGDGIAVDGGRLTLAPASGHPVPAEWLSEHERPLITEAARLAGVEPLEYVSYSVGNYGPSKRGGVSLQFRNLTDGSERYSVFNVETRRNRTTKHGKKGSPLPAGQFRITTRFKFYGFWLSTGLPVPRRLSAFHDYMGKLAGLVFTGTAADGERLSDVRPLSLCNADLLELMGVNLPDNSRTSAGQLPDNSRTKLPDKEIQQTQQPRGIQPIQTTGEKKHGNTVIRERGYKGTPIPPQEQTNEEWLACYERAG
ncbi:hypothetical protein [Microbulbifer variabilis]|uniref:hypothetical protein n=1 Tax=Microbulbifer variabilis TaxID=266805 RepID=UPI001CFF48F8|nr:hypothetical protein [Microbulbifer variabilis]